MANAPPLAAEFPVSEQDVMVRGPPLNTAPPSPDGALLDEMVHPVIVKLSSTFRTAAPSPLAALPFVSVRLSKVTEPAPAMLMLNRRTALLPLTVMSLLPGPCTTTAS